jgi:hypothetical protein
MTMSGKPEFDLQAAHRHFAAACFNGVWDLLDLPSRTAEQDQQMTHMALASLWHWTQRTDCTDSNLSVGYWQVSRVYAVMGLAEEARRYGELCLAISRKPGVLPFYLGYAYEALARAERVAGNAAMAEQYLAEARRIADELPDAEAKKLLLADLERL